jgi:hypothetical protein
VLNTDMPTFTWSSVADANHYDLLINDQTTGHQALRVPNVTGTSLGLTASNALTPGHNYIWYVGAVSTNGLAESWSAGQTFAIPALQAPIATGPTSLVGTDTPTFAWSAVAGANHYDLIVSDQTTGHQALRMSQVTGTSVALTAANALTPGHNFIWQVGAVSTNGQAESLSVALTFTIPALPAPLTSAPSGTIGTDMPTFSWTSVGGADHYDLIVSDQTTGHQALRMSQLTATSVALTAANALSPGHTYQWQVGAVSTNGQAESLSVALTFNIPALQAPVANGPAGVVATDTPTFAWSAVTGADHYDLWVNNQTTGHAQVIRMPNVTTTSVALTSAQALTPGNSYIWWVGSVSTNGLVTVWNPGQTFMIQSLAAPVTTSGPSGTITNDTPTFTWTAVTGAAHYDFWLNDQTTGHSQLVRVPVVNTTSLALTTAQALTPGHTYIWYVGSVSTNGLATFWSGGQTFTLQALTAPVLVGPIGTSASTTPTFTWQAVNDADHYDFWLSDVTPGAVQNPLVRLPVVAGTSVVSPRLLTIGHTYTWYVGAVSLNGQVTVWSAGSTFKIAV